MGATLHVLLVEDSEFDSLTHRTRIRAAFPGSTVTVLDSVILLQSDNSPVTCDAATFDHTASEMDLAGAANVNLGNFNDISPWFVNVGGGDFHLATPPASISTAALWTDGDPLVDIDGDARPGADQVSDVAGADVP